MESGPKLSAHEVGEINAFASALEAIGYDDPDLVWSDLVSLAVKKGVSILRAAEIYAADN